MLVLNRNWQPVNVPTVARSLVLSWNEAARVVDVARDHADGAARSARHDARPQLWRQMLDEEDGDSVGRSPGGKDVVSQDKRRGHVHK